MNDFTAHQLSCMSHAALAEYATRQNLRISELEKELEYCRNYIRMWVDEVTSDYANHSHGVFSSEKEK